MQGYLASTLFFFKSILYIYIYIYIYMHSKKSYNNLVNAKLINPWV